MTRDPEGLATGEATECSLTGKFQCLVCSLHLSILMGLVATSN